MQQSNAPVTEADILSDVIAPNEPGLSPEEARAILRWSFNAEAVGRMNDLAARNRADALTVAESEELQRYLRVGQMVNLMQAKARLSLQLNDSPA